MAQMIQLTFQPAFDPFHAVFRLLRLRSIIAEVGPLHRDHVRILDFYFLFPFRIGSIRLTQQHRKYRSLARRYEQRKPYGSHPEDQIVFGRMEPMQIAALDTLGAREFIVAERLSVGEVEVTSKAVPAEIAVRIQDADAEDIELLAFLRLLASEYDLMGVNGLKARTDLMPYRYDAV